MRLAATLALLAALPAVASRPGLVCVIQGPLQPWSKATELDVTVRCGPSKIQKVPGDCAMFTVEPKGGTPWTAWANEDHPRTVRTFKRGELLVVGDRSIRIYTRQTPHKDSRVAPPPPTANLLVELTMEERERLGEDPCGNRAYVKDIQLDGDDHLLVSVYQSKLDSSRRAYPAAQVRVAIADGTMSRPATVNGERQPQAAVVPDKAETGPLFPSDQPRFEKCGTTSGPREPPPSTVATAAPTAAVDLDRPLPEAKDIARTEKKAEGPPADRPTAQSNFGKKPMRGYKGRDDDSLCSSAPAVPLMLLAALALRRRRDGAR